LVGPFIGPRRPDPGRLGLSRECRPKKAVGSGSGTGWEGVAAWDQALWSRSNDRVGDRGGAQAGKPRWVKILAITGGPSMPVLSLSKGQRGSSRCRRYSRTLLDVDIEHPFEQPGPAQAGWCRGMGRVSVNRTGRKPGF
jgi:hypothetical protein